MTKLDNMAANEFKKLPKKKQKELNKAKRIPVAKLDMNLIKVMFGVSVGTWMSDGGTYYE